MRTISELNPDTVSLDGLHVIEAGAGTGKTYNITKLYLRLILEGKAEVSQILVVTFTKTATRELQTRLQKELEDSLKGLVEEEKKKRCRKALADFDNAPVFTIHGFCQRMLQDHTLESGFRDGMELVGNSDELLQEICRDFYRKYVYGNENEKQTRLALWKELKLTPEAILTQTKALLGKKNIDWPEGCELPKNKNLEVELQEREKSLPPEKNSYKKLVLRAALAYGEENFARIKEEKGVLTYDDLLTEMEKCLRDPQKGEDFKNVLRDQFRYVFVDEFQDTDDIQNNIFTLAFRGGKERESGRGIFLIGDPKQAIYAFRRGDVYTYLDATQKGEKHQLTCNWRSSPEFIAALNKMREKRDSFFGLEAISFPEILIPDREEKEKSHLYRGGEVVTADTGRLLSYSSCGNIDNAFRQMGEEIRAMVQEERLSFSESGEPRLRYSDIALLCVTNDALATAAKELRKQDIPCVLYKSTYLFGTPEAKELLGLLQAVRSPGDASQGMRLLLSPFFPAFNANELLSHSRQVLPLPQKLRELQELWQNVSFPTMFSQFLYAPLQEYLGKEPLNTLGWDPEITLAQILCQKEGQQSLATYGQLQDALHQAALSQRLGPEGVMKFLQERIQNAGKEEDKYPLGLTTEEDAVRLLTIHKSKGLEFPIVYVQGILSKKPKGNGRYHDYVKQNGQWEAHYDMSEEKEKEKDSKEEDLQENLRLFYVAVTRAKFLCRLLEEKEKPKKEEEKPKKDKKTETPPLYTTLGGEDILPETNDFLAWLQEAPKGNTLPSKKEAAPPTVQEFSEDIPLPRGFRSCSFSTLNKAEQGHSGEEPREVEAREDADDNSKESPFEEESRPPKEDPIFRFPRGARAGTCWHEILEELDFTRPVEDQKELWLNKLESYAQFPAFLPQTEKESRESAFQKMLEGLRETPLPDPRKPEEQDLSFALKDIPMNQRHSEFRFEYRLPDAASLKKLHDKLKGSGLGIDLTPVFPSLSQERWIFNGSIDLLFEHDGKYYIVDWKTNILDGKRDSFSREGMEKEMKKNQYTLQYLLYTVAFLRAYQFNTLGWELTEANYNALFGGVIYCFLRGVRKGQRDRHGFYAALPDYAQIKELFHTLAPIPSQP
ncbi:MAG: UvrD-helicase domain-containing protein [Oligosphaeraceae bacterium]